MEAPRQRTVRSGALALVAVSGHICFALQLLRLQENLTTSNVTRESYMYEVLNKVYLQNLYEWVLLYVMNLMTVINS